MSLAIRILVTAAIAVLAAAGAMATPATADAKKPCWLALLDDWVADARIDKAYPASCYREAMKHLPDDLEGYSSAVEDIERALLSATRKNDNRTPDIIEPLDDDEAEPLPALGGGGGSGDGGGGGGNGGDGEGLFSRILPRATGADSVPLPLLVLAGLATVLLAAAGVSAAARRVQARRATAGGGPGGTPPA